MRLNGGQDSGAVNGPLEQQQQHPAVGRPGDNCEGPGAEIPTSPEDATGSSDPPEGPGGWRGGRGEVWGGGGSDLANSSRVGDLKPHVAPAEDRVCFEIRFIYSLDGNNAHCTMYTVQ